MERASPQVEPPLFESEMTEIFVDTLKDPYFDRLVRGGAFEFTDLVATKDRIEKGLECGKIHINIGASNAPKRFSGNFQKKK